MGETCLRFRASGASDVPGSLPWSSAPLISSSKMVEPSVRLPRRSVSFVSFSRLVSSLASGEDVSSGAFFPHLKAENQAFRRCVRGKRYWSCGVGLAMLARAMEEDDELAST